MTITFSKETVLFTAIPVVAAVCAWGLWWILWLIIIGTIIAKCFQYSEQVTCVVFAAIGGMALANLARTIGLPTDILDGFGYSIVYWFFCYRALFVSPSPAY